MIRQTGAIERQKLVVDFREVRFAIRVCQSYRHFGGRDGLGKSSRLRIRRRQRADHGRLLERRQLTRQLRVLNRFIPSRTASSEAVASIQARLFNGSGKLELADNTFRN